MYTEVMVSIISWAPQLSPRARLAEYWASLKKKELLYVFVYPYNNYCITIEG